MMPPTTHAPKNHAESGELAATTEGALKIPAPITKPTINTIASISRKTGLGEASAEDKEVLDEGEIFFFIWQIFQVFIFRLTQRV